MSRRTGKGPSKLDLRRAAEAAERLQASGEGGEATKAKKKTTKRTTTKTGSKRTKKKVDPQRQRIVWVVCDNSNQQVAKFPFNQLPEAEKKVEEMNQKGRGPYFVQRLKEPMPIEEETPADD